MAQNFRCDKNIANLYKPCVLYCKCHNGLFFFVSAKRHAVICEYSTITHFMIARVIQWGVNAVVGYIKSLLCLRHLMADEEPAGVLVLWESLITLGLCCRLLE